MLANLLLLSLIVGSFLPSKQKLMIGAQHHGRVETRAVDPIHRLYHFASFGLTAAAFLLLATSTKSEAVTATLIFGLGCLIETTQCLLAKPHLLEWWDIRDDFYAVAAAFALTEVANAMSRRHTVPT